MPTPGGCATAGASAISSRAARLAKGVAGGVIDASIATMIITATSAAMGIVPTKSPNTATSRNRNRPAQNVEMRVRA